MLQSLKIKLASLKYETRVIKVTEQHELQTARRLRVNDRLLQAGLTDIQRARIINRATNRGLFKIRKETPNPKAGGRTPKGWYDLVGRAHIISSIVAGNMAYLFPGPNPAWIKEHDARFDKLRQRRILEVRREARITHLAYGFLRGVPYKAMERKSYEPPPWQQRIWAKDSDGHRVRITVPDPVERLALESVSDTGIEPQIIKQKLAEWKDAAGTWVHPDFKPHPAVH